VDDAADRDLEVETKPPEPPLDFVLKVRWDGAVWGKRGAVVE